MRLVFIALLAAASALAQQAQHSTTLAWTYTQGSGDPATFFTVQRAAPCTGTGCTGPGAFGTIGTTTAITTLSYVDLNVAAGQTWWYQVLASNAGGNSSPSNSVSATTPFSVPANAPGGLSAAAK